MGKPKIRFEGYSEDWEQRKVKDISDFIDGNYGEKYPRDEEFIDSGIPFFTSAVTGSEGIFNEKNVKYISTEKNRELTKAQSQGGDLILTNRGASMGVIAEIPEKYGLVNIGPQLTRIRGKEKEANNKYLLYLFQTSINNKKLTSMNAGSAMPFIGLKGLGDIDLLIPQYDEQLKIGEYFSCLDYLITLHQRKCDETKTLKKYMLQKMFPQNGEKVPEIRFDGFTEDWEQRKVSGIGNIVTGSTPKTSVSDNYGGEFLFVSPADIQENRYVDETITTLTKKGFDQGRKIREKASLFVSIGSTIGKVAQINQESTTNQQINAVEPYDNFDDDFIFTSLENISGSIKAIASNQAVPIVNKTTFGETEIQVPLELGEQQKIGQYFVNLDHLITLHQRKCNELKEIKKYMLQNMFV